MLWAAGVTASPAARWLKAEADNAGRVKVTDTLAVPNLPNVFVIGDAAASNGWGGKPVPGLAPAAKQGGAYIARVITARVLGMPEPEPFVYRHRAAWQQSGGRRPSPISASSRSVVLFAWWLWGLVHLLFLIGGRNRLAVVLNWSWSYFSFRSSTRLITGSSSETGRPQKEVLPKRSITRLSVCRPPSVTDPFGSVCKSFGAIFFLGR